MGITDLTLMAGAARYLKVCFQWCQTSGLGSIAAGQGIEKTSIQCPSLPDLGSQLFRTLR